MLQTFLGDIFSDLPEVSNFAASDRGTYESSPKTPMQLYLRRDPPEWAAGRYTRAENAVRSMASTQEDMAFRLKSLTHLIHPALAVGFCPTFWLGLSATLAAHVDSCGLLLLARVTEMMCLPMSLDSHVPALICVTCVNI